MKYSRGVLIISHSNYRIHSSGIEKFITDAEKQLKKENISVIHLFPTIDFNTKFFCEYIGVNVNGAFAGVFSMSKIYKLYNYIQYRYKIQIEGILLQQLRGWNLDILTSFFNRVKLPIRFFIHDYETLCPFILSTDNINSQCRINIEEPNVQHCKDCVFFSKAVNYSSSFHKFINSINANIEYIYFPSFTALDIWAKYFPNFKNRCVVRPHLVPTSNATKTINGNNIIRIAYLGSTAAHKGWKEWVTLVKELSQNKSFEFYYFGKQYINSKKIHSVHVDFQDPTSLSMSDQLLRYNIDFAFIWSNWPETYCYTYYEALNAKCIILTNTVSGNVSYHVNKYCTGNIFLSVQECINFLSNIVNNKKCIKYTYPTSYVNNTDMSAFVFEKRKTKVHKSICLKNIVISSVYHFMKAKYENN